MSRLQDIAARVAAASPGPWTDVAVDEVYVEKTPGFITATAMDAAFIAAARDDVPWLLAEVERLRALLDTKP